MASWIVPYLTYGAGRGWSGIATSGYRPRAEQERIYNSGVRPAARPGTSKHESLKYPGGAVDVTNAAQLAGVLAKEKGPHLLQWAGSADPVHFSHPVGGRTGVVDGQSRATSRLSKAQQVIYEHLPPVPAAVQIAQVKQLADGAFGALSSKGAWPSWATARPIKTPKGPHGWSSAAWEEGGAVNLPWNFVYWLTHPSGAQTAGSLRALVHEPVHALPEEGAKAVGSRGRRGRVYENMGAASAPTTGSVPPNYRSFYNAVEAKRGRNWVLHGQWANSSGAAGKVGSNFRTGGIIGGIGRALHRGGRIRFRDGGTVGGTTIIGEGLKHIEATAGSNKLKGALSAFNKALEGLTVRGLEKYRALFVREGHKPGNAAIVKSLGAAISSIDYALGLRIKNYWDLITRLGTAAERNQSALDRSLRKQGVDAASAAGLTQTISVDSNTEQTRRAQVSLAQNAYTAAKKTGNTTTIAEATEKLHAAQDELDETVTKGIEDRRNMRRAAVQEASDVAGFGTTSVQNSLAGLDIAQRLNRTAETPGGLSQKASVIQAQLLPALEGSKAALERQLSVLQSSSASASELDVVIGQIQTTGNEIAGAMAEAAELIREAAIKAAQELTEAAEFRLSSAQNALSGLDISQRLNHTAGTPGGELEKAQAIQAQILPAQQGLLAALNNQLGVLQSQGATPAEINAEMLQIQTAASDIGNSMAEAAELIREAAEQAAQETVDRAGHGTSMAQLGEQKLELEQRLGGTYEAGASQRADYITSTLIPALDSELLAMQTQLKVAGEQGNTKLAEQIAEQIAGKQNDILQAQLEAMEDVASNTNQRKLGGVLGFSYGNENLNDALISVGSGA